MPKKWLEEERGTFELRKGLEKGDEY